MRYRQSRTLLATIGACVFVLGISPSAGLASDDYFGAGDGHHGTKSVSGPEVVNTYSGLAVDVSVDDPSIEVADGTRFASGDLVMLWQVNGYSTPASGDQTEIDLSGQTVGRFELARVDVVLGNSLVLWDSMNNPFAAANTQLVFIPSTRGRFATTASQTEIRPKRAAWIVDGTSEATAPATMTARRTRPAARRASARCPTRERLIQTATGYPTSSKRMALFF